MENKDWCHFLSELGEDIERVDRSAPPAIELRGWWWKKHIPYYKRMRNVVQAVVEQQWDTNRGDIQMLMELEEKRERDELIRSMPRY